MESVARASSLETITYFINSGERSQQRMGPETIAIIMTAIGTAVGAATKVVLSSKKKKKKRELEEFAAEERRSLEDASEDDFKASGSLIASVVQHNDVVQAMVSQANIYEAMLDCMDSIGAARMILTHANNCGDRILYTATKLYATVFAEVRENTPPVRQFWNGRELNDPFYVLMLRDLVRHGSTTLVTKDLDDYESKELKGSYEVGGIEMSEIQLVHVQPGKIWYLSAGFKDTPKTNHKTHLTDCSSVIARELSTVFDVD